MRVVKVRIPHSGGITMKVLEGLRAARKMARERAFALGARPEKLILDVRRDPGRLPLR